ncbi:MAG: hypothetical protein E7J89_27410, partial [Enterobacter asburiae]|nr:hypothetical protein [Enterobacter asburiae]
FAHHIGGHLFYTRDKGITGRRAHSPIHPGAMEMDLLTIAEAQVPFSVVYGEVPLAVAAASERVKP